MTEFVVEVVKIGAIEKHPNADTLSVTKIGEYPIIIRSTDFKEGDLAIYVPVDAVVPLEHPPFSFLKKPRIKAMKLRGVFSMGLLLPISEGMIEGQNVAETLGIKKYEEPLEEEKLSTGGDCEHCPFEFPRFTDIESYRRYPTILIDGEDVVLTEKVHGTNSRFVYTQNRLWVGSHNQIKKRELNSIWWKTAERYELEKKLANAPDIVLFGEIFGWVQSLRYGHERGAASLLFFDALDLRQMRYLDHDDFLAVLRRVELQPVPEFYRGPYNKDLLKLAEGNSIIAGASNVREGIVIKPTIRRYDDRVGRVIIKHIGEGYLLK